MDLDFKVFGIPQPKGSTKGFAYAAKDKLTGRPLIGKRGQPVYRVATTGANLKTKGWQGAMETAALISRQRLGLTDPEQGPMSVHVTFVLPRPKSLKKTQPEHTQKPDIDKLARCAVDSMTGVAWVDDKQVTTLTAMKRYARPEELPHAHVVVHAVEQDPALVAKKPSRRDVHVGKLACAVPF